MPRLTFDPSISVRSLDELFSIALAMEKDSAARYLRLADRMRGEGREDLASLFEGLARNGSGLGEEIAARLRQAGGEPSAAAPDGVFSDEGIGHAAAELVDAYRVCAIAVRNAERAFAFWSYLAARSLKPEIRKAAERMAHAALEQAKALRRERRKAFSLAGRPEHSAGGAYDLSALEGEVCKGLEALAASHGEQPHYRDLAAEAKELSRDLASNPLEVPAGPPPPRTLDALCEWLADCYVQAGDRSRSQEAQARAQAFASAAIRRLAALRHPA